MALEKQGYGIFTEIVDDKEYQVNLDYEYEDQDITAILNAKLREIGVLLGYPPIYGMAAIDTISPNQLTERLNQDQVDNPQHARILLIPCNIGNWHWVGLLIEFDDNNNCIRREFLNSTNSTVTPTLNTQLMVCVQHNFDVRNDVIKQGKDLSCGACTIENLILRALKLPYTPGYTMQNIRAKQLHCLFLDSVMQGPSENESARRKRVFKSFNKRQLENIQTFDAGKVYQFKVKCNKSKSEIQAIAQIARSILELNDLTKNNIIAALNKINDCSSQHHLILNNIRNIFWNHLDDPKVQELSYIIFGIKKNVEIDTLEKYNKLSKLQFDYSYLIEIQNLVTAGTEEIEKVFKLSKEKDQVLSNLKSSNDFLRQEAAEKLRDSSEALDIDTLELLRDIAIYDVYRTVRIAAAEALHAHGIEDDLAKAKAILLEIIQYPGLGFPHQEGAEIVRANAAKALGRIGCSSSEIIVALKYAKEDIFENVRLAATNSLDDIKTEKIDSPILTTKNNTVIPQSRKDFLIKKIVECTEIIKNQYKSENPDFSQIKFYMYILSWRSNELSWKFKYSKSKLISEKIWHLLDYLCIYLSIVSPDDEELKKWNALALEFSNIADNLTSDANKELKSPELIKIIQPKYAESQLKMISEQLPKLLHTTIDVSHKIDIYVLLGVITVVGECAKRIDRLDPALPKIVVDILETMSDIRNLLEKKLPDTLFTSNELLSSVLDDLRDLSEIITNICESKPCNDLKIKNDNFKQLFMLLDEEYKYTFEQQSAIFFESLRGDQRSTLQYLRNLDLNNLLTQRFQLDPALFNVACTKRAQNECETLLSDEQRVALRVKAINALEGKIREVVIKLLDRPQVTVSSFLNFLRSKNICYLKEGILDIQGDDDVFKDAANKNITADQLSKLEKIIETLRTHNNSVDFNVILFDGIKRLPWLLDLSEDQTNFLKLLNKEQEVSSKEELDKILTENNLDGNKIQDLCYKNYKYTPIPYHKKFAYAKGVRNEINNIIRKINELIKLLVEIKNSFPQKSFNQILIDYPHYQFSLQLAIKVFGVIVKDKLGNEAKKKLLSAQSESLSAKHIWLLEIFRNRLAHRATDITPTELAWFALHWATLSYPELIQHDKTSVDWAKTRVPCYRSEIIITESILIEQAHLIQGLAINHGFDNIRVFGHLVGCELGIQAELNLLVTPIGDSTENDIFELQWQLHYLLGWNVKVYTEATLKNDLGSVVTVQQFQGILEHSVDFVILQNRARKQSMLESGNFLSVTFIHDSTKKRKKDSDLSKIDPNEVKTIFLGNMPEDHVSERNRRLVLLNEPFTLAIIKRKARKFTVGLIKTINSLDNKFKLIVLPRLKSTKELNNSLDRFYEDSFCQLFQHDPELTRFHFRQVMRDRHHQLPEDFRDHPITKGAKQHWDEDGDFAVKIEKEYGVKNLYLYNNLLFLIDEIQSAEIFDLLIEGENNFEQIYHCVFTDFCSRFLDLHEADSNVHFIELPNICVGNQNFSLQSEFAPRIYKITPNNLLFGAVISVVHKPINHLLFRVNFHAEVLSEIPKKLQPFAIIDSRIDAKVRFKVLNYLDQRTLVPETKKITIDSLFEYSRMLYKGKVQMLNCKAATFEFPPITDFDELLKENKLSSSRYIDHEEDRALFNEYHIFKRLLDFIYYYEHQVINQRRLLVRFSDASSQLELGSEAEWLNHVEQEEIKGKILLILDLQSKTIQEILLCNYINNHPECKDHLFKQKLARELTDWVYSEIGNCENKDKLFDILCRYFEVNVEDSDRTKSRKGFDYLNMLRVLGDSIEEEDLSEGDSSDLERYRNHPQKNDDIRARIWAELELDDQSEQDDENDFTEEEAEDTGSNLHLTI